jgi:hypothetical protein
MSDQNLLYISHCPYAYCMHWSYHSPRCDHSNDTDNSPALRNFLQLPVTSPLLVPNNLFTKFSNVLNLLSNQMNTVKLSVYDMFLGRERPSSTQTSNITFFISLSLPILVAARPKEWVGLQPLACWYFGCESRRGHGCLSRVSVVCCQVEVSASG